MRTRKKPQGHLFWQAGGPGLPNEKVTKSYHNCSAGSSRKQREYLGEWVAGLLFYLQFPLNHAQRQIGWHIFEVILRQYVAFKHGGGKV